MNRAWLWDRKLSDSQAKKILKNPQHRRFVPIAALLLARNNEPRDVFRTYLDPLLLCSHWQSIKRRMRKDEWNSQRIVFWQAIYEKLRDKYREKGIKLRAEKQEVRDAICKKVGEEIRSIRKEKGLSQKALAKKLRISQQLISRIEKGKENISLITLKGILKALDRKVNISFGD